MVEHHNTRASILPLMVETATVRKRGKTILSNISLTLGTDGFTIVMGPNGSGKTTLLRLMHGLERVKTGQVKWNCPNDETRTRQAFVFQTPVMMRRSVLQNIAYSLKVHGHSNAQAISEARHWADTVGLSNKLNLDAGFLSGGERQKLAIARALITKPDILFLDEPTTNLDGKSTREIETLLLATGKAGTRIVMTTHDIGQAKRLASDVVFLNRGQICEQADATKFFQSPQSSEATAYLKGDIID